MAFENCFLPGKTVIAQLKTKQNKTKLWVHACEFWYLQKPGEGSDPLGVDLYAVVHCLTWV